MTTRFHIFNMKGVRARTARIMRLALPLAFLLPAAACVSATGEDLTYQKRLSTPPPPSRVVLRPGDEIELKFPHWEELNDTQVIRPDGFITLQLVDSVQTWGLTPEELDEKLTGLYESKIKDPVISVVVRSLTDQRVYVGGEVNTPGLLTLQGEVNPLQAVINAGGFKETARLNHVIVIRKNEQGKAVPHQVNLSDSIYKTGAEEAMHLQPNDIVYVPKTAIANLDKFVDQYIAQLFLFRGFGIGLTYELRGDWSVE